MSYDVIQMTLAADVANSGTFTVGYPNFRDPGSYAGGIDHEVQSNTYGSLTVKNGKASFSFGASSVTVTNSSGQTLLAGTKIVVQLDRVGDPMAANKLANGAKMARLRPVVINLGAPDTADADGVCASQSITTTGTLNGALVSGGIAVFDMPRNVVAAWTTTAVMTVTGTDEYGNVVVESSASGTSMTGKKAFKTITAVSVSTSVTGCTVGTGDVLGLPVFLPGAGYVVSELQDGAKATAGTIVAGSTAVQTATTGDVRGTYDPNAACDGAKAFQLIAQLPDPTYRGVAQFKG